jgi:hypothetical protein
MAQNRPRRGGLYARPQPRLKILWTPVSTGVTTFYENIKFIELLDDTNDEKVVPLILTSPRRIRLIIFIGRA